MVANALRWTTRDLDAMPDDGGWKRHEIIDGERYVTRAPHIRHQGTGGNIHYFCEIYDGGYDLVITDDGFFID
jgi:flagellar basal body rod protein FlgF